MSHLTQVWTSTQFMLLDGGPVNHSKMQADDTSLRLHVQGTALCQRERGITHI